MAKIQSLRKRVWDKSGGVCWLCNLQMMPDTAYGQELSFTIEHVVPRSRGGSNEIENLEGTHQWCNQFKGENLMEEMPIGYRKILKWKIKNFLSYKVK